MPPFIFFAPKLLIISDISKLKDKKVIHFWQLSLTEEQKVAKRDNFT